MAAPPRLHELARLHGIQTAYKGNDGRRHPASPESLIAALRALRVPIGEAADIPYLVSHRRRELWERLIPPVVTAWQGGRRRRGTLRIRLPARLRDGRVRVHVALEDGDERAWTVRPARIEPQAETEVDGIAFVELRTPLPDLPTGYHRLSVEIEPRGERRDALLISAPRRAAGWEGIADRPAWGLFAPLYALHRKEPDPLPGGQIPTFYDLALLARLVAEHHGAVVGTLPLLAAFLDRPYEPSPYAPVSRLFWNELYTDARRALEWGGVERVGEFAAWAFPGTQPILFEREEGPVPLEELRWVHGRTVDPRIGMRIRRPVLESLAERFFRAGDPPELASFRARNPQVDDYARFRAVVERLGDWRGWPDRLQARDVRAGDYDDRVARYHVYVQWLAERQLAEAKEQAESMGVGLYLDLPLGVHSSGYDVWRERPLFARDARAGAPPDPLAAGGQDWGFPPLHPEANRLDGHRYFVASIRKHLRFAKVLRIDHVMQLHRMFWVVTGDARDGVYVRYPAEELYAILSLESHRAGAVIVGEDLGTVPREVRRSMRRHGLPGMYVTEFELEERRTTEPTTTTTEPTTTEPTTTEPTATGRRRGAGQAASGSQGGGERVLEPKVVAAGALASIGTHDTPTFGGWWWGRDIEIRRELGQIDDEQAAAERAGRGMMREKLARGLGVVGKAAETGPRTPAAPHAPTPPHVPAPEAARAVGVLRALHERLAASAAGLVLATMEDLWLETEPQNVPGTTGDANWRRRMAWPLEVLREPAVSGMMDDLNERRRGSG